MISADFPALIQGFFSERLVRQRCASPHTIASYRDTFRLLLFRAAPNVDPDDNAAPTTSWVKWADRGVYIGMIDFEVGDVHADTVMYEGQDYVPSSGMPYHSDESADLYGILTALGAYNPASAEVFHVTLEIEH